MILFRFLIVSTLILGLSSGCKPDLKQPFIHRKTKGESLSYTGPSLAYKWAEKALERTASDNERNSPRPTITSRYLALVFVAVFDAWSRYDSVAKPVFLLASDRRPIDERTLQRKEKAISYAAYRTLVAFYPADSLLLKEYMQSIGFDPLNTSLNPDTPEGIGNLAAKAVLEARKHDGSNQHGDVGSSNGQAYFDYSGYRPVNSPDVNTDINRWQPKYFVMENGDRHAPGCLTPFWGKVKPVSLSASDQFRSPPPPKVGSKQLEKEVKEVVELQANMTDEQKAIVEFMRDGPYSVQQAGHWLKFAMNVSVRDSHSLDQDVNLFFLNQVAAMDAFIACWDTKLYYDYARPFALVHHYYKDKKITGWGGPGKGWVTMKGQDWRPYSPDAFLCPAFPGYVSGHSTVSGACSEVLRLYTGDDTFGEEIKWVAGHLTEPDRTGDTITLKLITFTSTAEMAGISRVIGGYHIQSDNLEGLALGRKVGNEVYKWYLEHVRQ
ncbi:MAG TPA: vanadium-dependent haloperoxidase [Saprospiraceae bacterium]